MSDSSLIDGRYRLGMELGAGAFGSVYKATQVVLGHDMRDLALKLFRGVTMTEDNIRQMMTDALAILALLDRQPDWEVRQHFVTVYDLGVTREEKPRGFVAMELVRGGSLEGRLRDLGKFTLAGAFHHVHQLARGLAFMHEAGYVHSDLKPANVLVYHGRGRELVKIADFGLAGKYLGPLSQKGPAGGTMSYLPAEALMGLPTTPSGDVFSLGVIAYELLTGSNPYNRAGHTLDPKSDTYQRDLNRVQLAARHPALTLDRSAFPELADARGPMAHLAPFLDVVNRMLAEGVSQRYASAREVFADLERIAAGLPPVLRTGPEEKAHDPVADAAARCEGHLSRGEWPQATAAAREVVKLAPARGYLLQSRILCVQADAETAAGRPEADVRWFLEQAARALDRGLNACADPGDKRRVADELANVYVRLGDDANAEFTRRRRF